MGWRGQNVERTVFFQAVGLALVLWGRQKLADNAGAETSERRSGFDGVSLAQNVRSQQEVDEIVGAAERAGGRVTCPPAETSYAATPGTSLILGHFWEVPTTPASAWPTTALLPFRTWARAEPTANVMRRSARCHLSMDR